MKIKNILFKILIIVITLFLLQSIMNITIVNATSSDLVDSTMKVASIQSKMKTNALVIGGCVIGLISIIIIGISGAGKKKTRKGDNQTSNIDSSEVKQLKSEAKDYKIDSWGELIKILLTSGLYGVVGYWFGTAAGEPETWAFFGACFPWGYAVIGKIIDDWVEVYAILASGWLWFIVFILKIALSIMLGVIIMPVKLIISIVNIIQAHKLSKEVDSLSKDRVEAENEIKTKMEEKSDTLNTEKEVPSDDEIVKKLRQLKEMKDENIISDEEYEIKKKELLTKI